MPTWVSELESKESHSGYNEYMYELRVIAPRRLSHHFFHRRAKLLALMDTGLISSSGMPLLATELTLRPFKDRVEITGSKFLQSEGLASVSKARMGVRVEK